MSNQWFTVENKLGSKVVNEYRLCGGDIAAVSLLTLADEFQCVAKRPRAGQPDTTAVEAMMLNHLRSQSELPVPRVLVQEPGILVMSYIPHRGMRERTAASEDIAQHVASLHRHHNANVENPYGFESDTVIGPLIQPNCATHNWLDFFRDNRLLMMGENALAAGQLGSDMMCKLERLAAKLPGLLPQNPESSLLHGDLWAGNILVDGDRVAGFIDPAISWGHREMDLAFIDLTGGLDQRFFDAYNHHYTIEPGFYSERCALYQLWPLLVHTRLFGGSYAQQASAVLD